MLSTTEVACFYLSVWYLPLADAMTFYLAGPIYVTAMSALFLGEKVGIYRWSAVLVGFVGVLIALNPTVGSLGIGSLVALAGSFIYAIFMVVTRQVKSTPNVVLAVAQAAGGADLRRGRRSAHVGRRSRAAPMISCCCSSALSRSSRSSSSTSRCGSRRPRSSCPISIR